ncbi:MAG: hypothetical protein ABSA65_06695 [Acidimicrobiales bacterium]
MRSPSYSLLRKLRTVLVTVSTSLVLNTDDGDAWMAARRVSTDIAKASIECDDKALLSDRCGKDVGSPAPVRSSSITVSTS